jgi:glycosyltransferase involved in cell wall biosynthesis
MPKKILIIFWGHPLFDGRCVNMTTQLLNSNHDVYIMGVGNKSEIISYKKSTIQLIDKNLLNNSWTKYFQYFQYAKKIIKLQQPDVIIASDLYSMIPSAQIKSQHNAKIIYDSRELYTQLGGLKNKPLIQKIWSWYEKKYILKTDCVVANAEIDRDYLHKVYNHPNIQIMKNFPGEYFLKDKNISLKEQLCLDEETHIFLYQGKFHEGRGIRFSIKCISKIKKAVLVLIGEGPMKPLYIQAAEKENMHDRLIIMDAVPYEDLASFARQAFIGLSIIQPISKSYEHALPNKLFEYAVSGLPMICSNLKAMAEVVNQYKHGIVIKYNSKIEFHEAYQKILNNYNDYILNIELRKNLLWKKNNNLDNLINE